MSLTASCMSSEVSSSCYVTTASSAPRTWGSTSKLLKRLLELCRSKLQSPYVAWHNARKSEYNRSDQLIP